MSFWYQYAVGGAIFLIGLWFAIRQGEVGLRSKKARRNLIIMLSGYGFYFLLHLTFMILGSVAEVQT